MSTRRLVTLLVGVSVLAGLTWWRFTPDGSSPPRPEKPLSGQSEAATSSSTVDDDIRSFSGRTMGTTYTVKYVADAIPTSVVAQAVQAALDEVNATMSTYQPKSELSLFNRLEAGQKMHLSQGLAEVIALAIRVHEQTRGAFDITVGPLVLAYGFGADPGDKLPSSEELTQLGALVGMEGIQFDETSGELQKIKDGVSLDLGGIAKGYGVDQAAFALEKLSIKDYMVEVGGEIRVRGQKTKGRSWTLAIEEPRTDGRALHGTLVLPTEGAALATSGDYRNFRIVGDQTVSHTFDPRTKKPTPRRTASVSVVRKTAAEADALATALSVLSPEEAIALANDRDFAVYMLVHKEGGGFEARQSEAFSHLAFEKEPP